MPKAVTETPVPAFAPPGLGIDANRNIQQSPKGDPNLKGANFSNRRPNNPEAGAPLYPAWHYQRPLGPRDSMVNHPVSRASVRPSFYGPTPVFVGGPSFPAINLLSRSSCSLIFLMISSYISLICDFPLFLSFFNIFVLHFT